MRSIFFGAVLCLLLCVSAGAHAATMTYNVTFTASGPFTASGSYTLTFDPTQSYTNDTADLTVNSLSAGTQGASGFSFNPSSLNGYLTIGGVLNGVNTIYGNTNDYLLVVTNFNTASPGVALVNIIQRSGFYQDSNVSGTITAATPEPSSLLLLVTGLLGAAFVLGRRTA